MADLWSVLRNASIPQPGGVYDTSSMGNRNNDEMAWKSLLYPQEVPWYPPVPIRPNPEAMVPPKFGYRTEELGIQDVLNGVYSRVNDRSVNDSMMTDWSGQKGGYEATMRETNLGSAL